MTFRASREQSPQSPSNTNFGGVSRQSTAFRGASHAFSLAAPINCSSRVYVSTNGALAAATTAGGMRRQGVQPAEGVISYGQIKEKSSTKMPRRSEALGKVDRSRERSPSYAAALHAASKKSTPASTQKPIRSISNLRQPSPSPDFTDNGAKSRATASRSTDEAVVGATSSLVSLFESKLNPKTTVSTTHSVRYVTKPTSAIASPKPIKQPIRPNLATASSLSTISPASEVGNGFTASHPSKSTDVGTAAAAAQSAVRTKAGATVSSKAALSNILLRAVPEPPAPLRPATRAPLDTSLESSRTSRTSPLELSSAAPSRPLLPARSSSFDMKVDSLANTIVAASLASSRAPSPTKPPRARPPRQKSHSLFHNHHSQGQASRTPSPARAMRLTMRGPLPSGDDVEHKKKSILLRKHPHKHHEGDRKRYRATVTERERRRYDGVWAANRGLGMDADSPDTVLNLVVRDIWSRSRLPNDVLADIWDLVDIHCSDRLTRTEFVVGMWLIDQRLKGRKLPVMVSESLWNSVRLLHGVKVSRHQL